MSPLLNKFKMLAVVSVASRQYPYSVSADSMRLWGVSIDILGDVAIRLDTGFNALISLCNMAEDTLDS